LKKSDTEDVDRMDSVKVNIDIEYYKRIKDGEFAEPYVEPPPVYSDSD
jgi:hypothetical protein